MRQVDFGQRSKQDEAAKSNQQVVPEVVYKDLLLSIAVTKYSNSPCPTIIHATSLFVIGNRFLDKRHQQYEQLWSSKVMVVLKRE